MTEVILRMTFKGPQSKIGLFQKWFLHPYITLKIQLSKFKIEKKLKFWRARAHLLPKRNGCGWLEN